MAVLKLDDKSWEEVRPGVFRKIAYLEHLMTVMFEFRNGPWPGADPFHSHVHEQASYVAKGEIIFYCEGEDDQHLKEGDLFYIPSGKKHSIKVLSKVVRLVDSFTPIREDFLK